MGPASIFFLGIILVILVVLSYFFSSAETAFTAANVAKLNKLNTIEGGMRASSVIKLKNKKEQLIGAVLIGNNILNILSSTISTVIAFELFGAKGVFFSSVVITFVIIVFAEVLPKTYAINNPEKMALFASPLMSVFIKILYPLTQMVAAIVNLILKVVGKDEKREAVPLFEAVRHLITTQQKNEIGEENLANLEVINSILDLVDIHVAQIMTHRKDIFSISIDLPKQDLLLQALNNSYHHVPLWKDQESNIVALLDTKVLLSLSKDSGLSDVILDHAIERPSFVLDKTPISIQLHHFRETKSDFAIVQDEYGELKGIITLSDIVEEILGDVYLRDKNKINITKLNSNAYSISGKTHVKDINRALKWNLPHKNASTLAGIIMYELERVPKKDEQFSLYGYDFTILSIKDTSILRVKVEKSL